jgi:N,N-dimethylformamidase
MDFQAYFEEWSRRPGDIVRMAVSTAHREVKARFVRVVTGPGAKGEQKVGTVEFPAVLDTTFAGREQSTAVGSYARLPLPPAAWTNALTVHCFLWPTVPERAEAQTVWSLPGLSLIVSKGGLTVIAGGAVAATVTGLRGRAWYAVTVSAGPAGIALDVTEVGALVGGTFSAKGAGAAPPPASELLLSATDIDETGSPVDPFNGKIDSPRLYAAVVSPSDLGAGGEPVPPIAAWKFGADWASRTIAVAAGQCPPGEIVNGAERGVTGHSWDGGSDSFAEVPEQYAALQFHDDDMVDSDWDYDLEFTLPTDLKSGLYAVRLEAGGKVDHWPLFVMGAKGEKAPILFLLPTNTLLAYANDHLANLDFSSVMPHEKVVPAEEEYLFHHKEPGRSCYDTHSDGSPVRYSSRRRPIFNIRPGFPNWLTGSYRHFSVDVYFVEFLEKLGEAWHIATDEDLEREGTAFLKNYKVVLTGSHPEYWTQIGRAAMDGYLRAGGRLMYLGGNGFYWVTSRDPERPWVIEVRRDNSGTRCWDAPYGERMHVLTAEAGGLWRNRGKGPNKLVGLGFAAEGWSKAVGYRRHPASYEGVGKVFFAGIRDEVIGDFGHILDGAAGDEVDRYDVKLGSPAHATVLATSTPLGNEYQLVIEDQILALPDQGGASRPDAVCADIVYFPVGDKGGAVFSTGSITWAGSMAWNDFDNNTAKLTENVVRAFIEDELPAG